MTRHSYFCVTFVAVLVSFTETTTTPNVTSNIETTNANTTQKTSNVTTVKTTTTSEPTVPTVTSSTTPAKVQFGMNCSTEIMNCADPNALCETTDKNSVSTCQCKSGYYFDNTSCTEKVPIGSKCPEEFNTTSCIDSNSTCQASEGTKYTCQCNSNYYWDKTTCRPKVAIGYECPEEFNNTSCIDSNAMCQASEGTKYTCQCNSNYYRDKTTCKSKVAIGNECPEEFNTTSCIDSNSMCQASEGTKYTCQCNSNYYRDDTTCKSKVAIGNECPEEFNNTSCIDSNSICQASEDNKFTCQCTSNYYWDKTTCQPKVAIGNECPEEFNNTICIDSNSICQASEDNKFTCQCNSNYYRDDTTCKPKVAIGSECPEEFNNTSCIDSNSTCQASEDNKFTCQCNSNYYWDNTTCKPKMDYGQPCSEIPEHQCVTENATCIEHICSCDSSRYFMNESNECVLRPTSPSNSSLNLPFDGSVSTHGFQVVWLSSKFIVYVNEKGKAKQKYSSKPPSNTVTIGNLHSGTKYHTEVKIEVDDIESEEGYKKDIYTKPEMLSKDEVHIREATENSLTLEITPAETKNCDEYMLQISPAPENTNGTKRKDCSKSTSFTFTNLSSSTMYNIAITIIAGGYNNDATPTVTAYTYPDTVQNASVVEQSDLSIYVSVSYDGNNSDNITYALTVQSTERLLANTSCGQNSDTFVFSNNSFFEIKNLRSGSYYTIEIYSCFNGLKSRHPFVLKTLTKPETPTVSLIEVSEHALTARWNVSTANPAVNLTIDISPRPNITEIDFPVTIDKGQNVSGTYIFLGLIAGKMYTVTVHGIIESAENNSQGIVNGENGEIQTYTRPYSAEITVAHQSETSIEFNVSSKSDFEKLLVVSDEFQDKVITLEDGKCVVRNLTIGTNYTMKFYTMIGDQTSTNFTIIEDIWTRPPPPAKGDIDIFNIETVSASINITNKHWAKYEINYKNSSTSVIEIVNSTDFPFEIRGLTTGTKYTINVYSFINELRSEIFSSVTTYTRPGEVHSLQVNQSATTNSALYLIWGEPEGHSDKFEVNGTCQSPNNDTHSYPPFRFNVSTTFAKLTTYTLDPGTVCNVDIAAIIVNEEERGYLYGSRKPISDIETKESAPGQVAVESLYTNATSIYFSWTKPEKRNGVIRKYRAYVIDEYKTCIAATYQYACDECPNFSEGYCQDDEIDPLPNICVNSDSAVIDELFSSLGQTVSELHPYRNYSVKIQAFTKCWGEQLTTIIKTNISVPAVSPKNIIPTYHTTSLRLSWEHLNEYEEGNGPITNYTIYTNYTKRNCTDDEGTPIEQKNISLSNYIVIDDLQPYTKYSINISASTEAGPGPFSELVTYMTNESIPGSVTKSAIKVEPGKREAHFNWSAPCLQNGIITMYEVNVINNVRDPNNNHMISNNFTSPAAVIEPLNPYNNYTVKVRAYTSVGPGEFSEVIQFSTQADEPKKPNNISTISNNSTTLLVMWETPHEFTGPTSYIATANDQISLNSSNCTTYGFNANQCLIKDLKAYTNYTVKVITKTGVWEAVSDSKTGRTDQSTPGQVTNLTLIPEDDVTKPRSLQVTWNEPLERNGILLAYYVLGTYMNDSRVVYRNRTDDSASSYIFQNISTGVYSVQVFAETIKGNGSSVTNTTIVQAGAPIKVIDETNGVLLMQPSNEQPPDKERQIAVQLPLDTFLCDNSNGDLKRWGVIVAQEGQANDKAFVGSLEDFEKKESQYKNWFNIKDMESIPPYIATPKGWKANCPNVNESNRRKRAISHSPTDAQFIVGDHGQCSGVKQDEYCNGQLQPGRSYRVKSFVCTDGGCTETEYSEPLSTVQRKPPDPDLTIPIAAGIASAVVVIAIVALTIFVLRRKQAACFSKDDESLTTHTPGEGIHLDKIEHTKKNHFRQGPVKLTDFPDAVERFHRDSDLLFADAYKMLKEKSPNHLMTAAEQQCCRPKNRYTNILPFDHSRVKLRPSDDIEGSDYINANYIPGYTSRREYIATQGPMQATFDDFWRMVWEQNVDTIVMLTKLMEKGRHKCDKYWPDLGEPVFYGDLVVSLQSESNLSDYTIMIFEIKMKEERKMVRHFSYLKWPDMGCPETPELLLEFVKAVKQYGNQVKNKPSTGPTIVHCSAGVGRTGTFIAVDYLLQHIRDHDEVDIFNLVLDMRNHRLNMVQTEDQYIYIHECLKAFITTDEEEEEEEEEEAVYVNTGFGGDEENIYVNA